MTELRLPRLPDRAHVKRTVSFPPEIDAKLRDYAAVYEAAYGQSEPVEELIPYMLERFLDADPSFKKARRTLRAADPSPATAPAKPKKPAADNSSAKEPSHVDRGAARLSERRDG